MRRGTSSSTHALLAREPCQTLPSVNAITAGDCIQILGAVQLDILKIDIEGAEKEVFSAANLDWLKQTKLMIIELHDRWLPGCSDAVEDAIKGHSFERSMRGENLVLTAAAATTD